MDDCVFCKIVAGELPSTMVHEDDDFVAFADIVPKADTHLLVVPRRHVADLDAWVAAGGDSNALLAFASATAREAGVAGRYRLITNVGAEAGQEVFHLHWHVLAGGRWERLPGFGPPA